MVENLEDVLELNNVEHDVFVEVEGLLDDFEVVEVVEDRCVGDAVVQGEVVVVELLEDAVDEDVQDAMPDAGCEVASCIAVLLAPP